MHEYQLGLEKYCFMDWMVLCIYLFFFSEHSLTLVCITWCFAYLVPERWMTLQLKCTGEISPSPLFVSVWLLISSGQGTC